MPGSPTDPSALRAGALGAGAAAAGAAGPPGAGAASAAKAAGAASAAKAAGAASAAKAAGAASAAKAAGAAFAELYRIVARLRAPDGCPWDREQSPQSLRSSVLEEAYELVEAIDEGSPDHVREEAGDLYLLSTMIAYMHEEAGDFSVADSLVEIAEKLVRRHPHVFGEAEVASAEAVLAQWREIKEKVEGRRPKDSLLDSIPSSLPPLERAYKIQKKAAKAGFDWPRAAEVWAKAREELAEAEEACEAASRSGDREALEEELGDLLFSAVNLSRWLEVDPALALGRTVAKFERRFRHVERRAREEGLSLEAPREAAPSPEAAASRLARLDAYWEEAKLAERAAPAGTAEARPAGGAP